MAPKQEVDREYFRVIAECEKEQLGDVLATLARKGIRCGYELVTDVHRYNKRNQFDVSHRDRVAQFVQENAEFTPADLSKVFNDEGRPASTVYAYVQELVEAGKVRKLDKGKYQRIDVAGLLDHPDKHKGKHKPGRKPRGTFVMTGDEALWKLIKNRKAFTRAEMANAFDAQGRSPKSISAPIHNMLKAGVIRSKDDKSGYEVIGTYKSPHSKKLNGASSSEGAEHHA